MNTVHTMNTFYAITIISILLSLALLSPFQLQTQNTTSQYIPGYTWNKTTLQTLIVTSENQPWWNTNLINMTLRSINQWNDAITYFAHNYTDYAYLVNLRIEAEIADSIKPNYDIYVVFSQTVNSSGQNALGVASILPRVNGTIEKCTITIGAGSLSNTLTKSDLQDITTHEFGHALGLDHSNSSNDLMYPYYDIYTTDNAISTLNLYALATIFSWINNTATMRLNSQTIMLPSNIEYAYAPINDPTPKVITDNPIIKALEAIGLLLIRPTVLTMLLIATLIITITAIVTKREPKNN